ncbi:MAG: DegT/DnrJ/EryC1/StrS family aminotransferase [Bacteroidales bacterium]|jgi:dTDP-4-amino-4,6-dideoxygalactose transaminase
MINVTKTYLPDREKYKGYIDRIFDSGWLTNNGQLARELEKRLSEYIQVENIMLVANGTIALQIAYKALGIKGDAITTPFSFVATASSLAWEGIDPVFCDIDRETLNIAPGSISEKITSRTRAIIPVHVFGNSCAVEDIDEIARRNGLKVVYDAAHAFSIKYKGNSILNYGDASVLSFHSTKIFHTIEGGAIVFRKREDLEKARLMINFGIAGYDIVTELGINGKMNEFQAAMGLCILDDISEILERRKTVYLRYTDAFSSVRSISLQKHNPDADQNWAYFPVIFNSGKTRESVRDRLLENGIFARRYFSPSLETLPYLKEREKMPVSDMVSDAILCLPMYEDLSLKDQDKVIDIVLSAVNH